MARTPPWWSTRSRHDLIVDELQIAAWSADDDRLPAAPPAGGRGVGSIDARLLTDGAIGSAILEAIDAAGSGDEILLAAHDFADRHLLAGALRAAARGAHLLVLLDPNELPNQAAAGELMRRGGGRIEVRWYPLGSALELTPLVFAQRRADVAIIVSSANLTRRNLDDFNLEAGIELRMPAKAAPALAVGDYFAAAWTDARPYADYSFDSFLGYWRYRFAEGSGLSSF